MLLLDCQILIRLQKCNTMDFQQDYWIIRLILSLLCFLHVNHCQVRTGVLYVIIHL